MEKTTFCLGGGDRSTSSGEALASSLQASRRRTVGRRSRDVPHCTLAGKARGKANPASERGSVWHRGLTGGKNELLNTEREMHPVADKPKRKKKNRKKSCKWRDARRGEAARGVRGVRGLRQGKGHGGRGWLGSISAKMTLDEHKGRGQGMRGGTASSTVSKVRHEGESGGEAGRDGGPLFYRGKGKF